MSGPHVVALGGGHGLAATLRAVRRYAGQVTAVVATADDGGSSGRLRSCRPIPAPGDLRRCLVAMAGLEDRPLGRALEHRFAGTDVEGHALGNLLLAALEAVTGDFLTASEEVARLLGLDPDRARVVPATLQPVELWGLTADGAEVSGQVAVSEHEHIEQVRLEPPGASPPAGVAEAIAAADQIILGPGSLYTSVLAAAVVDDVRRALERTPARRVYVCNLRADVAESRGYDVDHHVRALLRHGVRPDVVLVDRDCPLLRSGQTEAAGVEVVADDVARPHGMAHDSAKLAPALARLT